MRQVIAPALGRIVLQHLTTEEKSTGGIWLPNGKEVLGSVARVVAICGEYETEWGLKGPLYALNDTVVIGRYNGVDIEFGREKYVILQETDILGKLVEMESEDVNT